jgi:predicted secreted protein
MNTEIGLRRGSVAAVVALVLAMAAPASAKKGQPPEIPACQPSTMVAPRVATLERPELRVEQNQLFVISLGSNPSTGYHWVVRAAQPVPFGAVGQTYRDGTPLRQAQSEQIIGVGGEQLLIFKAAVPPGVETMVMQYAPPGQAPSAQSRSQTFTIEVTPLNC